MKASLSAVTIKRHLAIPKRTSADDSGTAVIMIEEMLPDSNTLLSHDTLNPVLETSPKVPSSPTTHSKHAANTKLSTTQRQKSQTD